MKPPRTVLAAALALLAGSVYADPPVAPDTPESTAASHEAGHAADAGAPATKSVPDNFVGPLAPGECYASQCPGAAAPTEGALVAIGAKDAQPTVQQMEDGMLKGGVYKSIERTPDGVGAVITMPDGSIMWSDYKQGFDTMPRKPADVLKDPNASPAMISAAKTALMKQQGDKANGEKPNGDTAKTGSPGGFGIKSLSTGLGGDRSGKGGPETTEAGDPSGGPGEDQLDNTNTKIGQFIGNPSGGFGGGSGGGASIASNGDGGASGGNGDQIKLETADAMNTALTPDKAHFTFNAVNKAANTRALNDLRKSASSPSNQGTGVDDATRAGNTNFFGR